MVLAQTGSGHQKYSRKFSMINFYAQKIYGLRFLPTKAKTVPFLGKELENIGLWFVNNRELFLPISCEKILVKKKSQEQNLSKKSPKF